MEDATRRQVQALRPECHTELQNPAQIHKIGNQSYKVDQVPEEEAATEETEGIAQALERTYAETVETHGILDRTECKANGQECYKCHRIGHLAHMCRSEPRSEVKHLEAQQELAQSAEHSESTPSRIHNPILHVQG